MHSVRYPARAEGPRTALVLLPGFGDRDETFAKRGFVDAVQAVAPELTVVAADAYFGYYRKRTILTRLEEDVVGPLRREGFERIYLAGTSMGGHGAVAYARTHPEGIAGVLLFAPYLGPRDVVEEVRQAGGICKYAPAEPFSDDSEGFARANYAWLARQLCREGGVPVLTAVGADDRLAAPVAELSQPLPAARRVVLPGGHGWAVWTPAARVLASQAFRSTP
jgi:pimeloyl-ACP methyl ester carboxylesterase